MALTARGRLGDPGKVNKRRETDPDKIKPQGVLLNKKDLSNFQSIAHLYKDAEAIYLRENEFLEFDPYITLANLKILDLSMNSITGTIDFLPKMPQLRHLYMTSNKITSLEGFNDLELLETLCLSDNQIESFEGLDNLPNLRLLSLNYNQLKDFCQFPNLPSLHTLSLTGNPLVQIPSYRGMAIALSPPDLVYIDGTPVEAEERASVEHHRGKIVFCLGEGFVIEGGNVEEAADAFLLDYQRRMNDSKALKLQSIGIVSEENGSNLLTEGVPIKLNVCLQDLRDYHSRTTEVFFSEHIFPVVFKVDGEASEAFVCGSMNQWTDPIPLERVEEDGVVFFQTTLYLPAGDYEYRYIVDGTQQSSDEHKVTSKYKQGECNLYHVTKPEQQEDNETGTLLLTRWMRSDSTNAFQLINNKYSLHYTPSSDDIGSCIRGEVIAYINGDFSFQYFDISTPVCAGQPRCSKLEIIGEVAEGEILRVEAEYVGGEEGNSGLSWFRVSPDGEEVALEMEDPWAGYELGIEDIGSRIKVEFTPVREDWVAGAPVSEMTAIVAAGVPACRDMKIVGLTEEDQPLVVETVYSGGVEGASVYQWFRHDNESDEFYPIEGATTPEYTPTLEDVGKIIAVEYTPISKDAVEGDVSRCMLETPVEAAPPQLRSLSIQGTLIEQHVLVVEYDYYGGYHGNHQIQWYRREHNKPVRIGRANSTTYTLTNKDVGYALEVAFIPVRSDGVQGDQFTVITDAPIQPASPELRTMEVVGEPAPGNILELVAEYFGGDQGDSTITWSLADMDSSDFVVVAKKTKKYIVQQEDTGRMLKVTYTPVRSDGAIGEPKVRLIAIPYVGGGPAAAAAPPSPTNNDASGGGTPVAGTSPREGTHNDAGSNSGGAPSPHSRQDSPRENYASDNIDAAAAYETTNPNGLPEEAKESAYADPHALQSSYNGVVPAVEEEQNAGTTGEEES